jgi:hypothetical protein
MILAMIAAALAPVPASPALPELYAAIWNDLMLNGMIGNGNDIAAGDWYWGHDTDHPPTMRISDVRCRRLLGQRNCRFLLTRTPDPGSTRPAEDAAEHAQLACRAAFYRQRGESGRQRAWKVLHFPPDERYGGHSVTSMRCRAGS